MYGCKLILIVIWKFVWQRVAGMKKNRSFPFRMLQFARVSETPPWITWSNEVPPQMLQNVADNWSRRKMSFTEFHHVSPTHVWIQSVQSFQSLCALNQWSVLCIHVHIFSSLFADFSTQSEYQVVSDPIGKHKIPDVRLATKKKCITSERLCNKYYFLVDSS